MDAILSYPWLREKQLGVFPHLGALALEGESLVQLHSWDFQKEKNELDSSDDETDTHIRVVQKEFEVDWAQVDKIRAMILTLPTEVGMGGEISIFEVCKDSRRVWDAQRCFGG